MKFIYLGEEDSDVVTTFGLTFHKGVEVEVEDEAAISKLRCNQHFSALVEVEDEAEPFKRRVGRPKGK